MALLKEPNLYRANADECESSLPGTSSSSSQAIHSQLAAGETGLTKETDNGANQEIQEVVDADATHLQSEGNYTIHKTRARDLRSRSS